LLGGAGMTLGPLLGTAVMYYLIDISSDITSSYMIIVGAALLIVTLWLPEGLAGQLRRLLRRRPA
jgi:branched-chain amino acid transport system permease protein